MLAERAYHLKPETPWVITTVLELYTREGRWQDAEKIIRRAQKKQVLDEVQAARLQAIVHYQQALRLIQKQQEDAALEHARKAHKERLAFAPATDVLAQLFEAQGGRDKAIKLLQKSWAHQPHPMLVKRHQQLVAGEPPERRLKFTEKLVRGLSDHWESQMALAEAALAARQFTKAQNHLKAALSQRETVRLCRLMVEYEEAAFEAGHAQTSHAEEWRFRMMEAQPDARWVCDACQFMPTGWHANCPECGAFDHIHWHEPLSIHTSSEEHTPPDLIARSHMLEHPAAQDKE